MTGGLRQSLRRIAGRLRLALTSDRAFVESAYREILGREADQDGLTFYTQALRAGNSRTAVLVGLVRSEEFTSRLVARPAIVDIRALRPERYHADEDVLNKTPLVVFDAGTAADFDWLESMILDHGYYERPGVWSFDVDVDKRVMAEALAAFAPERALELGSASGAVLQCLDDLGVRAEGVEISRMAVERVSPRMRERVHEGDLLQLELTAGYDLVFGLDVFEHLNPNRLGTYLARIQGLLGDGGYVFANVPAFGADPVFGTVFPLYVAGWAADAAAARPFSKVHVDDRGFPLHGHLIWADSAWWVARFEDQGLRREVDIEQALHRKYDRYMEKRAPARRSYYVFSKKGDAARSRAVVETIQSGPSRALADHQVG